MKTRFVVLVLSMAVMMLANCAYLLGGGDNQDFTIMSSPEGATFSIATMGGVPVSEGTTPATINLKKKYQYMVTVNLDGYKENTKMIYQDMNPMVYGNILCGGLPGLVVDGLTGAMWNLGPENFIITLEMAALDGSEEQMYAVVSFLGENNQRQSIPILLEKENG